MKRGILVLFFIIPFLQGIAQETAWTIDKAHTDIGFTVVHMVVSEVSGSFTDFSGTVYADSADFSDARVVLNINPSSVNTSNERRDEHLRGPDFFDVEKYPGITFKSTSIEKTGERTYSLTGNLTMHGVTKPVKLNVSFGGVINDFSGRTLAGFKVTGTLNRSDFGLTYNRALESGGLVISDEVEIACNVALVKEE